MALLSHPSALLVRLVHVLAVATLLGGSALLWAAVRTPDVDQVAAVTLASRYEWLFWAAVGAIAATGVGNLGALGTGVPGPNSDWGLVLLAKLLAVAGLFLGSVVRTAAVVRLDALAAEAAGSDRRVRPFLRRGYGLTVLYLVALVTLAEVLAHG